MLHIKVPKEEYFDEGSSKFVTLPEVDLMLEHSLVSLSKWESKWEKPYLGSEVMSTEQAFSYIQSMCLNDDVPEEVFNRLSNENLNDINTYINAKMTATWFKEVEAKKGPNREIITAEVIYYWLFSATIPIECEHWHLNRLFTLLKVFSQKNAPQKKMSKAELAARNRDLNAERQRQYNTTG